MRDKVREILPSQIASGIDSQNTAESAPGRSRTKVIAACALSALALFGLARSERAEAAAVDTEKIELAADIPSYEFDALRVLILARNLSPNAEHSKKAPPIRFIINFNNRIWTRDKEEAEKEAALIAETGFNSVRFEVPASPGQNHIGSDFTPLCNAATAAYNNNLKLFINFQGYYSPTPEQIARGEDPKMGWVPQGPVDIPKFVNLIGSYIEALANTKTCVPEKRGIYLIVGKEPNLGTFFQPQYDEENNWVAPKLYADITRQTYTKVKAKGKRLGVPVTFIAGSLTSAHQPLKFIEEYGKALKSMDPNDPPKLKLPFDWWGHHPYPENTPNGYDDPLEINPEGGVVSIADYDKLAKKLEEVFGRPIKVIYGEYGIETQIPASKKGVYTGRSPATIKPVPEDKQAENINIAYRLAACQGVVGFALIHRRDDKDLGRWQSGTHYADGDPKSSQPAITRTLRQAAAGTLGNCLTVQAKGSSTSKSPAQ